MNALTRIFSKYFSKSDAIKVNELVGNSGGGGGSDIDWIKIDITGQEDINQYISDSLNSSHFFEGKDVANNYDKLGIEIINTIVNEDVNVQVSLKYIGKYIAAQTADNQTYYIITFCGLYGLTGDALGTIKVAVFNGIVFEPVYAPFSGAPFVVTRESSYSDLVSAVESGTPIFYRDINDSDASCYPLACKKIENVYVEDIGKIDGIAGIYLYSGTYGGLTSMFFYNDEETGEMVSFPYIFPTLDNEVEYAKTIATFNIAFIKYNNTIYKEGDVFPTLSNGDSIHIYGSNLYAIKSVICDAELATFTKVSGGEIDAEYTVSFSGISGFTPNWFKITLTNCSELESETSLLYIHFITGNIS